MGRLDYDYQHEPILFTWIKKHKRIMKGKYKSSTWFIDKPRASHDHPTMKPVELYENAMLNHTENGDLCYEPFCGSGTGILAAHNLGRKTYGMELTPNFSAVILQRFQDATGIAPELVN
jgi:site-specific DNA-methyltransferase (adenine-specific)